jgi:hypothetical protein
LPSPKFTRFAFPKGSVFVGNTDRKYTVLGWVRAKVNYPTLDPSREEDDLCKNAYNKAARDLLDKARKNGADAVVDMKSVVFLEDGRRETYATPECADDGQEGQILAQGIAVKWKPVQSADEDPNRPAAVLVPDQSAPAKASEVGKNYSATENESEGASASAKEPVIEKSEKAPESSAAIPIEKRAQGFWSSQPQPESPNAAASTPAASPFRPIITQ